MRKCPKTTSCSRLLLQKTGHWAVHDIKRFAIGAFLSSLLLKEQMMISYKKKPCARQYQVQMRLQSKRGF